MDDTALLLKTAFDAYADGDWATGKDVLSQALVEEPSLQNVASLITPIRNYATHLLFSSKVTIRAVEFMEALFSNPPETLKELGNFRDSEMGGVWIDVAFQAYGLGQMNLVRQAVRNAIRHQPGYLANRGVLSVWFEALLGQRVAMTFRDAKPKRFALKITLWRRSSLIRRYLANHTPRKLHVGCGGLLLPGWLNSDLSLLNRGGVVYIDATEKLPFDDNTLDLIFSEHFIEHLTFAQGRLFLSECYRVLRPGGICRLVTPRLEFLLEVYSRRDGRYEDYARVNFEKWVGGDLYSHALILNNFFHNWGHQCIYDFETLSKLLSTIGFSELTQCQVGESLYPELQGLERHGAIVGDEFNRMESMVIEAKK